MSELFDVEPYTVPDPCAGLGEDARRTLRHHDMLAAGQHPLGGGRHPDAPPVDDRDAPGPRCGTCRHKFTDRYHGRTFVKCDLMVTRGAATDIRTWWPACSYWKAAEERPAGVA